MYINLLGLALCDYFSSPEPLGNFQLDLAQKKCFQIWLNGRQYPLDIYTTLQSYSLSISHNCRPLALRETGFPFLLSFIPDKESEIVICFDHKEMQ